MFIYTDVIIRESPSDAKTLSQKKLCLVSAGGVYSCQTTCGCNFKLFLDLQLFQMRHICIEESVIVLVMTNFNTFKEASASAHFPLLFTFASSLWKGNAVFWCHLHRFSMDLSLCIWELQRRMSNKSLCKVAHSTF